MTQTVNITCWGVKGSKRLFVLFLIMSLAILAGGIVLLVLSPSVDKTDSTYDVIESRRKGAIAMMVIGSVFTLINGLFVIAPSYHCTSSTSSKSVNKDWWAGKGKVSMFKN
jgi:hypothetical protein